ncbi:MAG: PAS domain-containing protein, partial [Bacteroidales bacterium]
MKSTDKSQKGLLKKLRHRKGESGSLNPLSEDNNHYKKVEAELRASEIRYRRLFESAKDGILILDAETGRIVDVNPFLIKLLGYS